MKVVRKGEWDRQRKCGYCETIVVLEDTDIKFSPAQIFPYERYFSIPPIAESFWYVCPGCGTSLTLNPPPLVAQPIREAYAAAHPPVESKKEPLPPEGSPILGFITFLVLIVWMIALVVSKYG